MSETIFELLYKRERDACTYPSIYTYIYSYTQIMYTGNIYTQGVYKDKAFLLDNRALLTEAKALLVEAELFQLKQCSFENHSVSVH